MAGTGSYTIVGKVVSIDIPGVGNVKWPAAPTVANHGTAGATEYDYAIVSVDQNGKHSLPSPVGKTTTGNATLDGTNYNVLTWTPTAGAASQLVLRGGQVIATVAGNAGTYNDEGATAAPFTPTFAPMATINNQFTGGAGGERGGFVSAQVPSLNLVGVSVGDEADDGSGVSGLPG